jgi:fructose-specific phosphotransferase system IIC component
MPTLVAVIAASVAGYLASKLLGEVSVIGSTVVSFFVGILVYYVTKRFLIRNKP